MKKKLLVATFSIVFAVSEGQIQTPAASPAGSVSSVVGLTDVKIDYSRPRLRGRKIFGEKDVMYPHGSIWRTGANSGTKISFSGDVKVENIDVPAGQYLIFTWPGAGEWTLSLYKDLSLGGNTAAYDPSKEAAKFKVKTKKLAEKVETFTISIDDIAVDNKSAKVTLAWENTAVPITVTTDYDAQVMKAIAANTTVNPENYYRAASYYLETKKDLKQALVWMDLALQADPDAYFMLHQKAKIQEALGDKKGAIATATASLNSARKDKNSEYERMNQELIKSLQ
jgi:hypothetical protein